jgi:hypothetical protein
MVLTLLFLWVIMLILTWIWGGAALGAALDSKLSTIVPASVLKCLIE